jgi:LacI family transcriptional regulator
VQFVCDIYVPEVHAGVVAYSQAAGWRLLDSSVYLPTTLMKYHEELDGIVATIAMPELCQWVKEQNCPVARLLSTQQCSEFPSVEPDSKAIGVRGAEHLLSLGSPTFVFYRSEESPETRLLWEGFSETIRAAGHNPHLLDFAASVPYAINPLTNRQVRWEWLRESLSALPRPLAVMAEDDRFTTDLIEVSLMTGWWIPEDLSVLGVDNRALILGKLPVPISSIDSNLHQLGWAGAQLLDRMLDGEPAPKSPVIIQPGPVIPRRSTATFVCDCPAVSAAVNFLRQRYRDSIQVADVARASGLSTRSIQSAFRELVGCTISDELSRLRLAHASRLLRETDLKLESVAHESGLTSAKYLCDVFRASFNLTPTEFRESERAFARK